MSVILNVSLRNLLRQKRRNILLGTAIAFGAMVLILANSLAHGISEVLFNRVVKYANGHVSVSMFQGGNMYRQVFADGPHLLGIVRKQVPDLVLMQEGVGIMTRAIGNGKGDNVIMVGIDLSQKLSKEDEKDYASNFKFIEGSFETIRDTTVSNPVVLAEQKAKYLKVKKGDALRVRFTDIRGQNQAARLTVTGIFKPANMFMSAPVFLELQTLKRLAGYGPHDIATLNITVKNPRKTAIPLSNRIHDAIQPSMAVIPAALVKPGEKGGADGYVFGFRNDSLAQAQVTKAISLAAGDTGAAFGKDGVIISRTLAAALGIGVNDTCRVHYTGKYDSAPVQHEYVVKGVAASLPAWLPPASLLVNEKAYYHMYYDNWPAAAPAAVAGRLPKVGDSTAAWLAPEYLLCKRSKSTEEMTKLYREIGKTKFKGVYVDVESMYESASAILKMEAVLNMIALYAGLILFFVILIGVVNTLRMTIRERTREIGTMRAIGMQRGDVRNSFLYETGFLALFASLAGVAAAFVAMWALTTFLTFNTQDNPFGILLVKGHISFAPTATSIVSNILLIVIVTVITAWLPARRASRLSAANAMRHYE
jgi:ABC-type lipoprotein release transport system permease subunit